MKIPAQGKSRDEIVAEMAKHAEQDTDFRSGRTFGYAYYAGPEAEKVTKEAYMRFLSENALDPRVYPSLVKFENDVVDMAREHLAGGEEVVGTFTSGGTESCMLAVKTARDFMLAKKGITAPEMILPITVHAAFHKGAHYFGVKVVPVDVDPETFEADVDAVRAAVNENTVLIVGSAPSFAHGVIDPIEEMGRIAQENDVLLHVDACIGGFLLPYYRRLGREMRDWDFSVPGVSSISMDLHKYAYCAKGASVLMMRNKALREHQIFACAGWTGYSVVNTTMQSTKSGGPIAAAWATLNHIGDAGYLELAKKAKQATDTILDGVRSIPELKLMGDPVMSLLAFTSDEVDPFHIADEMKVRGWLIGAQLGFGPSKPNLHLTIGPSNVDIADDFVKDLREAVTAAKALPKSDLPQQIEAAFAHMSPDDISPETLQQMLAMAGASGTELPEREAEINHVLNSLPRALNEKLLAGYLNELFSGR